MQAPPPAACPPPPPTTTGIRTHLEQAAPRILDLIRRRLLASRVVGSGDLDDQAREAFQEFALETLRTEHRYDPGRSPDFWLHGIAMNVVRRRVERLRIAQRRLQPSTPGTEEFDAIEARLLEARPASSQSPDEMLSCQREVDALLDALPAQHREVLELYYFACDEDNDAVAERLGIAPGTARVRRCRALKAAREGGSR